MATPSEKAADQELKKKDTETATFGVTEIVANPLDKEILQQLDQIGNKATPTDPDELNAAYAEIGALKVTYGEDAVDDLIIELGATNQDGFAGNILGEYAKKEGMTSDILGRGKELGPYDEQKAKAAKESVTLNKEEKLKDNQIVVPPTNIAEEDRGLRGESFINLTSQTHQCILQHYIEDVAAFHRAQVSRGSGEGEGNDTGFLDNTIAPFAGDSVAKIILVDDTDPDSSVAPINALTSLGKTSGLSKLLPGQLANAMPKIRLYKIYREEGKETGKIEFIFPTETDKRFLTSVATEDSAGSDFTMTAGYAKGRAAGIKSFDWSFVGGDPFTATRDLTAKLTIFFQDFRDLTLERDGVNLLSKEENRIEGYKYLDLIVQPDCRKGAKVPAKIGEAAKNTTAGELVFNSDCYEIAVEVGYANTPGLPLALKDRNDTLYLTMVEHSFDIGQDGTFSLSIDYRARLATLLGDKGMNVLSPGGGYMIKDDPNGPSEGLVFDIREVEQELEAEQSKKEPNKTELNALRAVKDHLLYVRNNGLYRGIAEQLLKQKLVYNLDMDRPTINRFMNFNRPEYDRREGEPRKFLVGVDDAPALKANAIRVAGTDEKAATTETLDFAADTTGLFYYRNQLVENIYFTTVGNLIAVALDHISGDAAFSLESQGKIEDLKNIHKAALGESPTSAETTAAEQITAGSTVETNEQKGYGDTTVRREGKFDDSPSTVRTSEAKKNLLERFRVILGTVSYEDARSGKMKAINIAHLPVSMQMFRQFMIDRVISNQRAFYSFQDFVRDILTDIVFDSLQRICFGGVTQETQLRTGISLFNAQGAGTSGDLEPITYKALTDNSIYGFKRKPEERANYMSLETSAATSKNPIFTNIVSPEAKDFNYLMFSAFSVATINKNLHGNEEEDNDNGIAHFRYGSTRGMMKSVSFSKTPLEFAAEERYVREGTDNLLNQLAGRYEMQMSLVGNNMFIPGQYVYFDPVALGIGKSMTNDGSSRSLANLMGLGGYHIITEVGCSIAPGKFETTIKALWETGGSMPPATKIEGT